MSRSVSSLSVVLGSLLLAACSDSNEIGPVQMSVDSSRPGAGGSAATGAAGSSSASGGGNAAGASASTGGSSSSETDPGDIGLNAGGSTSTQGPGNAGSNDTGSDSPAVPDAGALPTDTTMSFFVTSRGVPTGANFGGLQQADALCDTLATAVSAELGAKNWRAYLSTATVNARDRIGTGPWFNQAGVLVANNVTQLLDQGAGGTLNQTWAEGDATIALDELGNQVPNAQHDILTGTLLDGTVSTGLTCADWTAVTGNVQIGHSNRGGGGTARTSWSSAHGAPSGCAPIGSPGDNVASGGGRGSIYCFAAD